MKIQEETRRLILEDIISHGNLTGNLGTTEFVRKVFPDSMNMKSEDPRYIRFLEEVRQHMEKNNDWEWQRLFMND